MARFILSAGVIPVHRGPEGLRYLLLRVYNYWDFPKGCAFRNEEPLATARRELEEETTLRDVAFRWGLAYRETAPYGRGKIARYYVAETRTRRVSLPVNPAIGRPEHHEYRWVSYEQARRLVADRVRPILDWAHDLVTGASSQPGAVLPQAA
jgi:8-oxo-dGTP pyrophosphatase MutT (NUDIX family)